MLNYTACFVLLQGSVRNAKRKRRSSFETHVAEALAAKNLSEADICTSLDILSECRITCMEVFLSASSDEFSNEVLKPHEKHLPFGLRKALQVIHQADLSASGAGA